MPGFHDAQIHSANVVPPRVPAKGTVQDIHVCASDVTKRFAVRNNERGGDKLEVIALDRLNIDIRSGEFLSLLGPSGCGKTTLLRMIAGLVPSDGGSIAISGKPITGPLKQTAMVFQNFGLLPWRSVLKNVEFPLELDGMDPLERKRTALEFLEVVGLGKFLAHYPHELSGGMQQRVGIARALARRPSLLLMDEPFAALDAQTREELQEEFMRIWASTGSTVVFVTHSIDEALVMSDRIAVFAARPGRVRALIESPFEARGAGTDVRADRRFAEERAKLRDLLR